MPPLFSIPAQNASTNQRFFSTLLVVVSEVGDRDLLAFGRAISEGERAATTGLQPITPGLAFPLADLHR
jgi:hypothetical protein